jgi:aspirochlorine biosynthesis cytochrome P450 monooxygenase
MQKAPLTCLVSHMMRDNDASGMTLPEMEISASIFMTAGSETSSSLLVGCMYYVLRNPAIWSRLCTEVRQKFATESEITFSELQKLEYLNAVIEEGLRLYAPVPSTFPRTVPLPGENICNRWVPGGYSVGVNPHAATTSESNFSNALEFHPERWLGDKKFAGDNKRAHQPFGLGPRSCIGKNLAYAESRRKPNPFSS